MNREIEKTLLMLLAVLALAGTSFAQSNYNLKSPNQRIEVVIRPEQSPGTDGSDPNCSVRAVEMGPLPSVPYFQRGFPWRQWRLESPAQPTREF